MVDKLVVVVKHTFCFPQGMQDALQRALSTLLQQSPHRRVALVTFNNEVEEK